MGNSTSKSTQQSTLPPPLSGGGDLSLNVADAAEDAPPDKLRDGPCAATYLLLEKCQQDKRIVRNDRALTVCVSETDLLIKCIHRHPAYFQTEK